MQVEDSIASGIPREKRNFARAIAGSLRLAATDPILARVLFVALLVFNLWGLSIGWSSSALPGNEFRQSQTAQSTLFIQREKNFSLAYPTPVLGKPWSIPMEFPLYQWTVAAVSSVTGQPLIQAARWVSALCFYLTLPAIWLLLKRIPLNPTQRLITLSLVLTCPLYIFYARGFLIETMALMFSVWFLQGFVAAVEQRGPFWVLIANVAGIGAGLVKVTTFLLYLLPAAMIGVMWVAHAGIFRSHSPFATHRTWRVIGATAACVVGPFIATCWWIQLADAIKALNASGAQLVSSAMSGYHFGTWQARASSEPWLAHWNTIRTNLAPMASLVIFAGVAVIYGGRWRSWILVATLVFLAGPLTFPVLYSWHEYYFVANGIFLMLAVGLALSAMLESSARRWVAWTAILAVHTTQVWGYFHYLYPTQRSPHQGGSGLTRLLRDVTDPQDVLLIAGNDWSSVIPFYAERRALMIRTNLERNESYLQKAFASIADESVPLVILAGEMRGDQPLLARISTAFNIDPEPFLVHKDQTVYASRAWREDYSKRLFNLSYNDVTFANPSERRVSDQPHPVSAIRSTKFFNRISPLPERYQVPFGLTFGFRPDGRSVFDAHAPTRLWFKAPPDTTRISVRFGVSEEAYTRTGGGTDGVEFVIKEILEDGTEHLLFSRFLDPAERENDRTTQRAELNVNPTPGAEIVFETGPGPSGSNAFDWSYWEEIELR